MFTVGGLAPTFTLLSNEDTDELRRQALRLLSGAQHIESLE